jgi:hypothetical protein
MITPTCELIEWSGTACGALADGWLDSPVRGPVPGCWRCACAVTSGEPSRWAWHEVDTADGPTSGPEMAADGTDGAGGSSVGPLPAWLITPESLRGLSRAEVLERLRAFVDAAEAVAS